ncbi:MAG: hypothetical protein WCT08_03475 [Patescibacteria group bacterium]|jgi:hypothetical protein
MKSWFMCHKVVIGSWILFIGATLLAGYFMRLAYIRENIDMFGAVVLGLNPSAFLI